MTDKAYAVPLHELLAHVPRGARLEITDPDGMGTRFIPVGRYCHEASEALRARLAQPEPEPVAWISHNAGLYHGKPDESLNPLPLYTVPPQRKEWVGLTREELEEISEFHFHGALSGREFYDDVEAKLKEKNI